MMIKCLKDKLMNFPPISSTKLLDMQTHCSLTESFCNTKWNKLTKVQC